MFGYAIHAQSSNQIKKIKYTQLIGTLLNAVHYMPINDKINCIL